MSLEAQKPELRFGKDGKFKIVQITDTHCIPGDPKSEPAFVCVNEMLDKEKPDLVVFTGDVIFGKPAEEGLRTIIGMASSRKIPFAVTFGNHDDEPGISDVSREKLLEIVKTIPGNLTDNEDGVSGVCNFALPILSSDGKGVTKAVVYGFDSHSYLKLEGLEGYDYIKHDQIGWYRRRSAAFTKANGGKPLLSLAFMHIPVIEYAQALLDLHTNVVGTKFEAIGCSKFNSGLFVNFLEMGDVKGVFSGHEHNNDFVADYKGILLGYGRYSGGDTVYNDIPNGARVIELTEGSDRFETWVRVTGSDTVINRVKYPGIYNK